MSGKSKWRRPLIFAAVILGGVATTVILYETAKKNVNGFGTIFSIQKRNIKKDRTIKTEEVNEVNETDLNITKENLTSGNKKGNEDEIEEISLGYVRKSDENYSLQINKKKNHSGSCEEDLPNSIIPGTQKVYVSTFGCSHNKSDSETMLGLLQDYGYKIVNSLEEGDLCIVNSCTVKNPSQEAMTNLIKKAKGQDKRIVVTGCVPQSDSKLDVLKDVSLLGVTQIHRIVDIVEQTFLGNRMELIAKAEMPSLDLPKLRKNKYIEIVPISGGCLGSCTFCKTKYARGDLRSYQESAIIDRINYCIKQEGVKQIWLTSEDLGAYGLDIGTHIINLLNKCTQVLEVYEKETSNRIMLRIGMTNPPYMLIHSKDIVKILNHRNVFRFLHIPVQSGSNTVLDKMNREYYIEDFKCLVDYVLDHVPRVTLATDIICGFPTETCDDHQKTLKLMNHYKFPIVNISQFYSRPQTPAAKYPKVKNQIIKKRSQEASALFRSYKRTEIFLNSYQRVWFTEIERNQVVGHTIHYIKCVVPLDESLLGNSAWVYISDISKWHVVGVLKAPEIDNLDSIDELYSI